MIIQGEVTLHISGMFCTNCSSFLQDSLSKLKGVFGVSVDLAKEVIRITYNAEKRSVADFKKVVVSGGYKIISMDSLIF